tara:strand:- start:536 stop:1177 length:642 start_codon:yes stop_codon:yes gene_type:complete
MYGAIIGGVASIASGIFGASAARKQAEAQARERRRLQTKLNTLENNRQEIINPYQDLSSMISNPFANLSVATGAAEIQIEQADIALATTLDTLRATGASAGGATALAQAALKSKKEVAASIETQEKNNEDKRAAGEKQKQDALMREGQRVQQGEAWEFGQRETRQMQELDRTAAMLGAARQAESQARSDRTGAITGAVGGLVSGIGSYYGSLN